MYRDLISRPRVERRLRDAVSSSALTLLQAPLGAGKTAAVSMAFDGMPGVVRIEAQPWHRRAFVDEVVAAIREVRPDFGRMTRGSIEAGAGYARAGALFARELAHIDAPLVLVIDNAHVFSRDPDFARFIDAAIEALPPAARMIVIGRSLPDVRLSDGVARSRATIVDGEILAFDGTDVAAVAAHLQRPLDDETAHAIAQSTQGWAMGIMLALTAPGTIAAASSPRSAAQAYFAKELLPSLDPDLVRFLEDISVHETLDTRVLGAQAQAAVEALRHAGAPIVQEHAGIYRVHPLLREAAASRLQQRDGEQAAHHDAARAYAQRGAITAALFHADAAGDGASAAAVLSVAAQAAVATGDDERVRRLALRIEPDAPHAAIRWYTLGLLEKARGSAAVLSHFSRALENAPDDRIAFGARVQAIEYQLGHELRADEQALRELHDLARALGPQAQSASSVLRGWAAAIAHNFDAALDMIAPHVGSGDATAQFNTGILAAYVQTALGDTAAAQDTLDALIETLEDDDRVVLQTLTLVWFARLGLMWGQTTAAADAAAAAERLASALDLRAEEAALYIALAEIATHTGSRADAVRYAERARRSADRAWYAADTKRVRSFAEIALARAAFLGHDNAIARDLALRVAADPQTPSTQRALACVEGGFYTLLSDPEQARERLGEARAAVTNAQPVDAADAVALSTADDVLAFLDAANGLERATAVASLTPFTGLLEQRRGLVTLEHAGLAMSRARRGEGSDVALETALEQMTASGPRFEARLVRAYAATFVKPRAPARVAKAPALDLTPREREILELLVDGLSNKEIAQRLIVSPRTIETHVERVLGKLEVGSRSRAIAKAIRLGLVSLESVT